MHGWLQILSRYGLFKETLRVFLQNLRKQKPGLYEETSKGLSGNYLDKEFDLTEKDHEKAVREVVIREKPVGDEIISTPHNTDARYAKKGRQSVCGQKGFLTETCDKNNKTQFLTDAAVTSATTADVKELPPVFRKGWKKER